MSTLCLPTQTVTTIPLLHHTPLSNALGDDPCRHEPDSHGLVRALIVWSICPCRLWLMATSAALLLGLNNIRLRSMVTSPRTSWVSSLAATGVTISFILLRANNPVAWMVTSPVPHILAGLGKCSARQRSSAEHNPTPSVAQRAAEIYASNAIGCAITIPLRRTSSTLQHACHALNETAWYVQEVASTAGTLKSARNSCESVTTRVCSTAICC